MMRAWRERDFARGNPPSKERMVLKLWAFAARRPRLYHALTRIAANRLARRAGARGAVSRFPFLKNWTGARDLPAPEGRTFHDLYARARREKAS
jgi:L-lactate dehydrogenase complex protein LldF